jgi:hypothetical protein
LTFGSFIGAVFALFLPETAGVELPDTVAEAEQFGKDQKWLFMPGYEKWLKKRAERKMEEEQLKIQPKTDNVKV